MVKRCLLLILPIVLLLPAQAGATSSTFATVGSSPFDVAVDSQGRVYVANYGSNTVSKLADDGSLIDTLTVGSNPQALAVDQNDNVYVVNYSSNSVSKITAAGAVTANFAPTGTNPTGIAIGPDDNIYVTSSGVGTPVVSKISPDGTPSGDSSDGYRWAPAGNGAKAIAFDSQGNAFVANTNALFLTKIAPNGVASNFGITQNAFDLVIDDNDVIYTANYGSKSISRIDSGGNSTQIDLQQSVNTNPYGIAIDSDRNLYTANFGSGQNNVSKINPNATPDPAATTLASTDTGPINLALDSSGVIYTANWGASSVTKIVAGGGTDPIAAAPPNKPAAPTASGGNGEATVSLIANPISAIFGAPSSYVIKAVEDGTKSCVITPPDTSCVVAGLTNGQSYTFKAQALLNAWQTTQSAVSNAVTPQTVPAAPTDWSIASGNGKATVTVISAPDNGGAAISGYKFSVDNGASWSAEQAVGPTGSFEIANLTNGTTYPVKIRAVNSVGDGAPSAAKSATPIAPPNPNPNPNPNPDPNPEPQPQAIIETLKISGPKRVKRNKRTSFTVVVKNSGNLAAESLIISAKGRGVKGKKSLARLDAGASQNIKLSLRFNKKGRVRLSFTVSAANASGSSVNKTITVR